MRGCCWAGLTITMVVAVAAIACGDSSGPEAASVAGHYLLQTVNDHALPYEPSGGDPPITGAPTIISGALILTVDGSCTLAETIRNLFPPFEQSSSNQSGTYTRTGATVTMVFPQETMSLTFSNGNTLTWAAGTGSAALVFVYRK